MLRKWFSGLLVVVLLLSLSFVVFAQESSVRGNLGGSVLDQTGAVVSGAKVTINGPTGANTATTGGDGRFFFPVLTPGIYTVKVEKQGFRTAELKGVEVVTGRTASVSMAMQPGQVSETIEVSASAITVDTASSAVGANLNDQFYSRVPVARNVTGIFYASPGVNSGGGTGAANPSISGGSGLENQYVADGVNITDGAFGGIGVYSRVYGSLSTGINLSFVKEVQVKTGGFEPQYGKSTGGLVQIVTKSGSNVFHGGLSGYIGPQQFEADRINSDDFNRLNEQGRVLHNGAYDVSGELGGYVPGLKDRLFFFTSVNPSWTRQYGQFVDLHGTYNQPLLGQSNTLKQSSYNYAEKLTLKITDKHQFEVSLFGDPTRSNVGPFNNTTTFSPTTFSKLDNGTRNLVGRWNATLSPTWLANVSLSWGHNYLTEAPSAPNVYQVQDFTGCGFTGEALQILTSCPTQLTSDLRGPTGPMSGIFVRQGLGYYENTDGDNMAINFDTQKIVNKLGSHTFTLGYHWEHNLYRGERFRSGPFFPITSGIASGIDLPEAAGLTSDAAFTLRYTARSASTGACPGALMSVPGVSAPGVADQCVILRQTRGEFGSPNFNTSGKYHAAYVNDAWTINKHVTVNLGYRWDQQRMTGTPSVAFDTGEPFQSHYTFTDNWSPRFGLAIDPIGNKKTKIFGNFARYSYAIPLDMAIRSLSNELDFPTSEWIPPTTTGAANAPIIINPDGTIPIVTDTAHFRRPLQGASLSSTTAIATGTKMQYTQEWVAGVEHEFGKGVVVNVRWIDRRLKRAVEDMAGLSPEAYICCLNQQYLISNPGPGTDIFINPIQKTFPLHSVFNEDGDLINEAACPSATAIGGTVPNASGADVADVCVYNPQTGGNLGSDGIPDGFVQPVRIYKGVEVEANKSFSSGWQIRTNYRWSQLSGNYEGAFRNDNGQSDPSISSLFDFTRGDLNLLGNQFDVGWLNTDRRHILNSFISYSFAKGFLKNLTLGTGVRVESGIPINRLRAHPAYQNAGEIPEGGRGSLGRTPTTGQADIHTDYAIKLNEKHSVHLGADLFNITNQKSQLRVDQNVDRNFGVPNADFFKPTQGVGWNPNLAFQRPFYARLMLKWVF